MDIQDVLRILKNGAEKPKDDLNDYTKGKRDGQVQAYSHAWTLVKNLALSGVVNWLPLNKDNYNLYEKLAMKNNCYIRYDNGQEQYFTDKEMPFARVTHFRPKS